MFFRGWNENNGLCDLWGGIWNVHGCYISPLELEEACSLHKQGLYIFLKRWYSATCDTSLQKPPFRAGCQWWVRFHYWEHNSIWPEEAKAMIQHSFTLVFLWHSMFSNLWPALGYIVFSLDENMLVSKITLHRWVSHIKTLVPTCSLQPW